MHGFIKVFQTWLSSYISGLHKHMSRSKTHSSGKMSFLFGASPVEWPAALTYPARRGSLLLENPSDLPITEPLPPTHANDAGTAILESSASKMYPFIRMPASICNCARNELGLARPMLQICCWKQHNNRQVKLNKNTSKI